MSKRVFPGAALAAVAAVILFARGVPAQEGGRFLAPPLPELLEEKAESVVSIKFVLKVRMSAGGESREEEQNGEARGMLVSEDGLIVTANSHFEGGLPAPLRRLVGGRMDVKATPLEIKVLFGNEVEEYDAQYVGGDSNLGLAFVQIMDLRGRKVRAVPLQDFAGVAVGEDLVGVTRMARGFDCAPALSRLTVKAKLTKPRAMWAVVGADALALEGLPVFNRIGVPVGILSIQSASEGAVEEPSGFGMLRSMADSTLPAILPLSEIARVLKAARTRAAEALEEWRERSAEEGGGTGETPPGGEKDPEEAPEDDG